MGWDRRPIKALLWYVIIVLTVYLILVLAFFHKTFD